MITQLTLFTTPAAPNAAALRARCDRELASYRRYLAQVDPAGLYASNLRALIAAAEQQRAALEDDERREAA